MHNFRFSPIHHSVSHLQRIFYRKEKVMKLFLPKKYGNSNLPIFNRRRTGTEVKKGGGDSKTAAFTTDCIVSIMLEKGKCKMCMNTVCKELLSVGGRQAAEHHCHCGNRIVGNMAKVKMW